MDTIYALSTGPSVAGVAVIRISGPRARDVAGRFRFRLPKPRMATLRRLVDPRSHEVIDQALVLLFPAPDSFTGDDVIELQVHGSRAVTRWILQTLGASEGFRPAEAGEFSRRAFLNGKMDLLDVEALGDLLAAETRAQIILADHNRHNLRGAVDQWRQSLIELRGLTEALIDFSDEDDVLQSFDSNLQQMIGDLRTAVEQASQPNAAAEIIRDGFRVALLGPPNAGKSSLLNTLARRDVAIVSDIAGTTRDVLEVHLDLGGHSVILMDTAGIRETVDPLEREGISRTKRAADAADYRIWLQAVDLDGHTELGIDQADMVITTKSDKLDSDSKQLQAEDRLAVSVRTGEGINALIDHLATVVAEAAWRPREGFGIVHERQIAGLKTAVTALREAEACDLNDLELRAEALRSASVALDRLIGRIEPDQVLDVVFSRFCIGK
jgi:tRNA modification GTPase